MNRRAARQGLRQGLFFKTPTPPPLEPDNKPRCRTDTLVRREVCCPALRRRRLTCDLATFRKKISHLRPLTDNIRVSGGLNECLIPESCSKRWSANTPTC